MVLEQIRLNGPVPGIKSWSLVIIWEWSINSREFDLFLYIFTFTNNCHRNLCNFTSTMLTYFFSWVRHGWPQTTQYFLPVSDKCSMQNGLLLGLVKKIKNHVARHVNIVSWSSHLSVHLALDNATAHIAHDDIEHCLQQDQHHDDIQHPLRQDHHSRRTHH